MDNTNRIYSKTTIVIISAIGSTFFGSLLYIENLKETKKRKFIVPTIIFSIVYTLLIYKVSLVLSIPFYYSFCPLHFVGGFILAGPFWKFQIGHIENYIIRKIWVPLIILLILDTLVIFLNIYSAPNKLNPKEFKTATSKEISKQTKNKISVVNDSTTQFFDIVIPLMSSSTTYRTEVEDVNTLFNIKDFEEGRFTSICIRIPLKENEKFDFNLLGDGFKIKQINGLKNDRFESLLCANYTKNISDTLVIKGTVALIKVRNTSYSFLTQFVKLDKGSADSLSYDLIDKIRLENK